MSKLPEVSNVEFIYSQIGELKSYLQGRVLTIIDASITDLEQRKAVKDLVKNAIWSDEGFTRTICNRIEGKPLYENNEVSEWEEKKILNN